MAYKIQLLIVVAMSVMSLSMQRAMDDSDKICTLEGMKMFAAQACEHIFERRILNKRQIQNYITDVNDIHENKYTNKGHHLAWRTSKIRRRDYPKDGYLLLDHHYAKILSKGNHDPEYVIEPSKWHSKKFMSSLGLRDKRANGEDRTQLHYCCAKRCVSKDFCKR